MERLPRRTPTAQFNILDLIFDALFGGLGIDGLADGIGDVVGGLGQVIEAFTGTFGTAPSQAASDVQGAADLLNGRIITLESGDQIQGFGANSTWFKPANAKTVEAVAVGGGAGGARGNTTVGTGGAGGGGGGGGYTRYPFQAVDIPDSVPIIIGGFGAGATADNQTGGDGGDTQIVGLLNTGGGRGGRPGSGGVAPTAALNGQPGFGTLQGFSGGGYGANLAVPAQAGGNGPFSAGGAAPGGAGAPPAPYPAVIGPGSGGGGGSFANPGRGGNGGAGGPWGGGGGGGGGWNVAGTNGNGGPGYAGAAWMITKFS